MPRKYRKNNLHIQEKKAIATRLIQISLILDDFVYKHKEISESKAKSFIVEISSFKSKCIDDPRSLQVIEKLTLILNSIINEHKNKREILSIDFKAKEIDISTQYAGVSSIHFQTAEIDDSTEKENNTDVAEVNNTGYIINLPEESHNKLLQELSGSVDDDEIKSILDLVILDSGDEATPAPETINFQNVTNQYEVIESQDIFNIDTQDENQIINTNTNVSLKEVNAKNENLLNTVSQTFSNLYEIDYSQSILSNCNDVYGLDNLQTQSTTPNFKDILGNSKDFEKGMTPLQDTYPTSEINIQKPVNNHQSLVNVTNQISNIQLNDSNTIVSKILNATANVLNNRVETKSKPPRKRKINAKSQENIPKENKRKPRKKKDVVKKNSDNKYNTNTGSLNIVKHSTDLSWIENIKYVREISTAEHHTRSIDLSHDFWKNYSLPNDWDDIEFEYKL